MGAGADDAVADHGVSLSGPPESRNRPQAIAANQDSCAAGVKVKADWPRRFSSMISL